ncbi:MAG TPA: hypothetical protein VFN07_00995 [Trueperaceae bacterium]|nr:hypothetical protein [Trueperaceae bacterium]
MPRVRNLVTDLEHDVPAGHYSLKRPDLFTVLTDPDPTDPDPTDPDPTEAEQTKKAKRR